MRIDSTHSSSVCTRPLPLIGSDARRPVDARTLERAVAVRDAFEAAAPGRISGPKLEDLQPRFCARPPSPSDTSGAGWAQTTRGTRKSQKACLEHVEKLHGSLRDIKLQYTEWKAANPTAPEPTDGDKTMGEILELPVHEQCVRILCVVLHEHPQILDETGPISAGSPEPSFGIPGGEIPGQVPTPPASPAPAAGGDFLSQMGQLFGPLAQMLGGLLGSPLAIPLLAAAANLIPPPVGQIVAVAIPFLAPIAGQLLSGVGGAMAGAPGAAGATGAPDLGALVSGFSGLLGAAGGVPGVAPAPVPLA